MTFSCRPSRRLFCAVFAILAASGCGGRRTPPAAQTPYVDTSVTGFGSIEPARRLAGVVAPYQNVAIQSTLAEPAETVYVREGDAVRAGELSYKTYEP